MASIQPDQSPEPEDDPAPTPDQIRKEWIGETLHGINLRMDIDGIPVLASANDIQQEVDRLVDAMHYLVERMDGLSRVPGHDVWLSGIIRGMPRLILRQIPSSDTDLVVHMRANITEIVRYLAAHYCNMYI